MQGPNWMNPPNETGPIRLSIGPMMLWLHAKLYAGAARLCDSHNKQVAVQSTFGFKPSFFCRTCPHRPECCRMHVLPRTSLYPQQKSKFIDFKHVEPKQSDGHTLLARTEGLSRWRLLLLLGYVGNTFCTPAWAFGGESQQDMRGSAFSQFRTDSRLSFPLCCRQKSQHCSALERLRSAFVVSCLR